MMLLAFRPCGHIWKMFYCLAYLTRAAIANIKTTGVQWCIVHEEIQQIIGAAGDDRLYLSYILIRGEWASISKVFKFIIQEFCESSKVGISLICLLFFGGHERLRSSSEPITHDQRLRSCQSNDTACTIQSKGLCNPGIFPWIGSECDTSRPTYIPFLQVFLQFVICPCLCAHISSFASHSSMGGNQ